MPIEIKKKSAPAGGGGQKSGIRKFKPGEVLFQENDAAESLYIIQRGQIRLYLPKGRGFVEIGILRTGEVIGEMAYFDEKSRRRSCSAAAIVSTEVVEISFNAFAKTMQGLNPWFKTIINTLADRLRKTNDKVKKLESNSVGFSGGGKISEYKFFTNTEVIKILCTLYLAFKSHGEVKGDKMQIHTDKIKFYGFDVYSIKEVVYEEFKILLEQQGIIQIEKDPDGLPKIMTTPNMDLIRSLFVFFNSQRQLEDEKQLKISPRCEKLLIKMVAQLKNGEVKEGRGFAKLTPILEEFKAKNIVASEEDLADSSTAGFTGDIVVDGNNELTVEVHYDKLVKAIPAIKLLNAIKKVNETKNSGKGY